MHPGGGGILHAVLPGFWLSRQHAGVYIVPVCVDSLCSRVSVHHVSFKTQPVLSQCLKAVLCCPWHLMFALHDLRCLDSAFVLPVDGVWWSMHGHGWYQCISSTGKCWPAGPQFGLEEWSSIMAAFKARAVYSLGTCTLCMVCRSFITSLQAGSCPKQATAASGAHSGKNACLVLAMRSVTVNSSCSLGTLSHGVPLKRTSLLTYMLMLSFVVTHAL